MKNRKLQLFSEIEYNFTKTISPDLTWLRNHFLYSNGGI
jgi:hypothetical protein